MELYDVSFKDKNFVKQSSTPSELKQNLMIPGNFPDGDDYDEDEDSDSQARIRAQNQLY